MYVVLMADFPVFDVLIAKTDTIEEATRIMNDRNKKAIPYQNYYIKTEEEYANRLK